MTIGRKRLFSFGLPLCLLIAFLFGAQAAFAQQNYGNLRGIVTDPNGGAVPGASVVAKNEATGVETPRFVTSGEGSFAISNLLPGSYTVTVSANGFKTRSTTGIAVRLGVDSNISIGLEPGGVDEVVTVVASADEVAQTTSEITANFDSRKVTDLPSNAAGGGIDTLALNIPGVTPGFGNVNSNGTTLSVNGNRARSNNFTIDGTDNNDLSIGGPSYFVSNADMVSEFQVITNNYSAQYGRNQGAIVNIITKGGTNEFSGTAFWFHRNASALDAMDNIEARDPTRGSKDKFISNVFGGTFGGPIVKNKAFFFGSYQGIRQAESFTSTLGTRALALLPSEFARIQAAFPGNNAIKALAQQGSFALSLAGTPFINPSRPQVERICISASPGTNCVLGGNETGFFDFAEPSRRFAVPFTQDEFSVRGDWNITPEDNLSVRFLWQDSVATNALGGNNGFTGDIPAQSWNISGFYTRQFSASVYNNFQATGQRLTVKFGGGCTDPLTGCIPDPLDVADSYALLRFSGLRGNLTNSAVQSIGQATNLPQGRIVDVYQFGDKLGWNKGNHSLLFGADIRYLKNSVPFLPNINGNFLFSAMSQVVANMPASLQLADGEPTLEYKQWDRFFFIQDDWRVRPNLTLNLGLRYEYSGQPINLLNDLTVARESNSSTAFWRTSLPIEARTFGRLPADKNNFAPRLGFAWSPDFGDSKFARFLFGEPNDTVLRGGFSIAYDPVFYNIMLNISTSAPIVFLDTLTGSNVVGVPSSPTGSNVRAGASSRLARNTFDPRLLTQTKVSDDFHSPYAMQYSFGIQRQLNASNVFEIRYVGNRGKDLFQTVNANPLYNRLWNGFSAGGFTFPNYQNLLPSGTPAPQVCVNDPATPDNEAACNNRLLAGQGLRRIRTNTGDSQYDSLQARYNGRFLNKNLNLGASYTFSKAIDNASEIFSFGESAAAQNAFDVQAGERGLSGFHRPHSFSLNFIYDLPFYKSQSGAVGRLLGGWQINGVYNLATGRPYTPQQYCAALCGFPNYEDTVWNGSFIGWDNVRPFNGNPNAPAGTVGINQRDAALLFGAPVANATGFYSFNELNNGNVVTVTQDQVRYIYNGPGAAMLFGTPWGNVGRNSAVGPKLNNLNFGVFKTTNITEKVRMQFRAEFFNVLNHPNSSFGVSAGATQPGSLWLDDAGFGFDDFREAALSSRRVQFGLRLIF